MATHKTDAKLKVTWLQSNIENASRTAAGSHLEHTEICDGKVVFDPFVTTSKAQTMDYGVDRIKELWESGKITDDQAIEAMKNSYRVNHSIGRNILYDNRVKVENRVNRYVEYAVAAGKDAEEARKYAIQEILAQGSRQGSFAGNGWGGIVQKVNILET